MVENKSKPMHKEFSQSQFERFKQYSKYFIKLLLEHKIMGNNTLVWQQLRYGKIISYKSNLIHFHCFVLEYECVAGLSNYSFVVVTIIKCVCIHVFWCILSAFACPLIRQKCTQILLFANCNIYTKSMDETNSSENIVRLIYLLVLTRVCSRPRDTKEMLKRQ